MAARAADDDHGTNRLPHDPDLVEYLVVSLPDLSSGANVAEALRRLVESSRIWILDLVGVVIDAQGRYTIAEPELVAALADLKGVGGQVGGFLSEDDIALACKALRPGSSALILVAEDLWAQDLAEAARTGGGQIVGGERIPRNRLEQAARAREVIAPDRGKGR